MPEISGTWGNRKKIFFFYLNKRLVCTMKYYTQREGNCLKVMLLGGVTYVEVKYTITEKQRRNGNIAQEGSCDAY